MKTTRFYHILLILCFLVSSASFVSCKEDEPRQVVVEKEHTLFMYYPWSSNLLAYFETNLSDMEIAMQRNGLANQHVVVFLATSATEAEMFVYSIANGKFQRTKLKDFHFETPAYTTAEGIKAILEIVKASAPAKNYSMIIGGHGMGWLPVNHSRAVYRLPERMHWDYEDAFPTRFFGGTSSLYQTDITVLATGISQAGLHFDYVLFDDCYMASVEVAYELREVADFLVASPCEIMAYGMPYERVGKYLLGNPDYRRVCEEFYEFYAAFSPPCGTLSVIDCRETDAMAAVMKKINATFEFDETNQGLVQRLDGYTPVIFYDFGDYVKHLCNDETLLDEYNRQLERTVPFKTHTEFYYSQSAGKIRILDYSGLTISDPSTNGLALESKKQTSWWKATH